MVALQVEGGGVGLVLGVIVMVTVVHVIEAYVLNPRIYGYHMKLHPLVVLVVLYLAQHLFGFWGLIVAVPVTTYIWRHVIMGEADTVEISPSSVGSIEEALEGSSAEAPAAAS